MPKVQAKRAKFDPRKIDRVKSITLENSSGSTDTIGASHIRVADNTTRDSMRWYLCSDGNGNMPAVWLIYADTFEHAYEYFVDEFEHLFSIDDRDLPDYLNKRGEYEGNYSSSGTPVDTDTVVCTELSATDCVITKIMYK